MCDKEEAAAKLAVDFGVGELLVSFWTGKLIQEWLRFTAMFSSGSDLEATAIVTIAKV